MLQKFYCFDACLNWSRACFQKTYINKIGQVIHEILLDGGVGRVHAQHVLVPGLGGLHTGVLVLLLPLLVLLLNLEA